MALIVQKYGGTSVGSIARIKNVAQRIAKTKKEGHDLVVVVSAMSGETDRLLSLAKSIQDPPPARELDVVLSTGEQVTIGLMAMMLQKLDIDAVSYTGWQVPIFTNEVHGKARIKKIEEKYIREELKKNRVVVIAGFQGINDRAITTLGRGGSDTSAVAVAACLKADECQIYTDVEGVYTTDPRVEPRARKLDTITFEEMLELASLGSKVLQIRSVAFAGKYGVRLRVLSSLKENPGEGTLITFEGDKNMEHAVVSGIAFDKNQARVNVKGVPDRPGVAYQILGPIAEHNIEVDMIIQPASATADTTDFSFTLPRNDYQEALRILKNEQDKIGAAEVDGSDRVVKISAVGLGMHSNVGVASKIFKALADEGINIQMISTSEIKVSVLLDERYLELATRVLHQAFELEKI